MSSTGPWRKWYRAVGQAAIGATAAAVVGCGGGGDAPSPAPAPAPAPVTSPSPAPVAAGTTCGLPDFNNSLLARVNQARAAGANCGSEGVFGPAGPVAWNDRLTQAAVGHSRDMAANNYFSHTSLDGRELKDRVNATGYGWHMLGENIAAGQRTVDEVVNAWLASPGHCANIMRPNFVDMGVACVAGTSSDTYGTYWTQDFGQP